jgi:hypothetical protein
MGPVWVLGVVFKFPGYGLGGGDAESQFLLALPSLSQSLFLIIISLFFILLADPHTKVSAVVKVEIKAIETIEIKATTTLMAGKGVVSRT